MTIRASYCKQKEIMTFKMTKREFYELCADIDNNESSWIVDSMIGLGDDVINESFEEARGRAEARQMESTLVQSSGRGGPSFL